MRPRPKGHLASVVAVVALHACGTDSAVSSSSPSPTPSPATCPAGGAVAGIPALTARRLVSGLQSPLDVQSNRGDRERLYVVEQGGTIRILRGGQLQSPPFLDISDRISTGGERGLLGLALHPSFASNGRFFVNYTDRAGDTHVAEFRAISADVADPTSERQLLFVRQPFANHNGGGLAFGNDGRLYVGLGDGGSGGDPLGNGQRLDTFLAKMLRIDVDGTAPYAIPSDNPFRSTAGALPEIWAYGLRNPFRFAFDRANGDLYIGDVGQSNREEVDVGSSARHGGENYGWNTMEGLACYPPGTSCDRSGLTLPVYDYGHDQGCSITGGVVYRGCRMPDLTGTYFFGDFCSGFVRSLRVVGGQAAEVREWPLTGIESVSAFGVDADGEVYVVDYGGSVFRLEPAS